MRIKKQLLDRLCRFYQHVEKFDLFPQPSNLFSNQLQKDRLELLIEHFKDEGLPDHKAIDLILNLIRSVQFNHKPVTALEENFFNIFHPDLVRRLEASLKTELKAQQASTVYIHFSGTGMPIFARHCANEFLLDDLQFNHQQHALVYRVAGVACSADGLWDPDSHQPDGRQCYRERGRSLNLSRINKINKGQGVCRAALDAYHFVLDLASNNCLAKDVNIVVLGHSRGAIEGLIFPHLLHSNEITKNYQLNLCLNDPVPGGEIEDRHLNELQSVLNKPASVEGLMYSLPENVRKALIFIARSEMRAKFTPLHIGKMECSHDNQLEVLEAAGYHNSTLFANHCSNFYQYSARTQSHLRKAGLDNDRRGGIVRNFYLEKLRQFLGFETQGKNIALVDAYGCWMQSFKPRPLMNPGYHLFQSEGFRDNHMLKASVPELFWDKHHEQLFNAQWPNLSLLIREQRVIDLEMAGKEFESLPANHKKTVFDYMLKKHVPLDRQWRIRQPSELLTFFFQNPEPAKPLNPVFQEKKNPYYTDQELVKQRARDFTDFIRFVFTPESRKEHLSKRRPGAVRPGFNFLLLAAAGLFVAGLASLVVAVHFPLFGMLLTIGLLASSAALFALSFSEPKQKEEVAAMSLG